jgi:hypothetical protein
MPDCGCLISKGRAASLRFDTWSNFKMAFMLPTHVGAPLHYLNIAISNLLVVPASSPLTLDLSW